MILRNTETIIGWSPFLVGDFVLHCVLEIAKQRVLLNVNWLRGRDSCSPTNMSQACLFLRSRPLLFGTVLTKVGFESLPDKRKVVAEQARPKLSLAPVMRSISNYML